MADRDVQMIRIIVGDGLPVEVARPHPHRADRAHLLEAVGRDLFLIGRHHLGDRGQAVLEPDEQEPAPIFERDGFEAILRGVEPGIFGAVRNPDQLAGAVVAPRVIGAGQHLGAPACPVDQPRAAVAADVGEGAHRAVVAAQDDDRFAEIIDAAPLARAAQSRSRGRRSAARRAGTPPPPPRRIRGRDRASRAGSGPRAGPPAGARNGGAWPWLALAISSELRQWPGRWRWAHAPRRIYFERQPEGACTGASQRSANR